MLMVKLLRVAILGMFFVSAAYAADDVVSAVHGTVTKVDSAAKTVVVKTADGTEHVFHVTDEATVHGAGATETAAKDSWHGIKEGSEVVAHYTKTGADETAVEFDKVGKGGLKVASGTVKDIDRGTKKIVVTSADGTESAFRMTGHATKDAGKDIAEGTEKGAKVTVYYTESAGKKIAHFFEKG
jgi:hypothetical protein